MSIWDYLEEPTAGLATPEEDEAVAEVVRSCGSANTALLRLYRAAVRADERYEGLLDEIDRVGKLQEDEVRTLQGLPASDGRNPLRPAQS